MLRRLYRPLLRLALVSVFLGGIPPAASVATVFRASHQALVPVAPPPIATPPASAPGPVPVTSNPVPHPEPPPPSLPAHAPRVPAPDVSRLPLAFVPNAGQTDPAVRFHAHGLGGMLFFTPHEVVLTLPTAAPRPPGTGHGSVQLAQPPRPRMVLRVRFDGASATPPINPTNRLPGTVNFLIGNDPAKWHTNLPAYAGLVYQQLYPGIDLQYDGTNGQIKSSYLVAPGADPTRIQWRYQGARDVQVDAAGNLVISLPPPGTPVTATSGISGTVTELAPQAWQTINGQQIPVTARYTVAPNGRVGFVLGAYDHAQPLTIDPSLTYSTFLGGGGDETGYGIAVDSQGSAYVTGQTSSTTFPTTTLSYDPSYNNNDDAFVTKLSPDGSAPVYSTYLGGNGLDRGFDIAVDGQGYAYITGETWSSGSAPFPTRAALQGSFQGSGGIDPAGDAFVTKLSQDGRNLIYSTYLGSSSGDYGTSIAVDGATPPNAYVTGTTYSITGFPTTAGALQTANTGSSADAFVTKLVWDGTVLNYGYSTYLGGDYQERGQGIAVDSSYNAYVTGTSNSANFPPQSPARTPSGQDAFVIKLIWNGTALSYGYKTFLVGNADDYGNGIALDSTNNAYVTGGTYSTIFATVNPLQPNSGGGNDAFVAKVNPAGGVVYNTYLGGSGDDNGLGVAVDSTGKVSVIGATSSGNFPNASGFGGGIDVFVATLDRTGSALLTSIYLGGSGIDDGRGIAVDSTGYAYVTGTASAGFPFTPGAYDSSFNGGTDVFVAKLSASSAALADDAEPCPCEDPSYLVPRHAHSPWPVDTHSGNFWTSVTDLAVSTPGPQLAWNRVYVSQAITSTTGVLGYGWQHSFGARLMTASMPDGVPGQISVFTAFGNRQRFTDPGTGSYAPFPGVTSTLVHANGVYTQTLQNQTQFGFDDANGRLLRVRDPQGRLVTLTYDTTFTPARLTSVVDTSDSTRHITLTYDTGGRIKTVSDGTRTVQYTYDTTNSNLTGVTDVMGRPTTYTYLNPTTHLLTQITNALGQSVESISYDAHVPPRVSSQTLQDNRLLQFGYLSATTLITTTGVDGRRDVTAYDYAADNTLAGIRNLTGPPQALLSAGFDPTFSPRAFSDGKGNTTRTTYTANGLPLAVTNALGQSSQSFYDASNNLIKTIDVQGVTSLVLYDTYNNLISTTVGITTTSPIRVTTLSKYQYKHASGVWDTTQATATDSRLFEQTSPDGVVTHYDYADSQHPRLLTKATVGYGTSLAQATTYAYDSVGRVVTTTLGFGTPLARVDITRYNADNTVAKTIQNYTGTGNFSAAFPDRNVTTSYGYDKLGRTVAVTNTLGQVDVTHYDPKGRVDWSARNVTLPVQFDANGLPFYHAYSRLAPDRNVNTLYGYDGLNRTTLVTQTGILTGTFNPISLQFSDVTTRTTRTDYDALSRPMTVTLNYRAGVLASADTNIPLYTRYDGAGNVITQTDALGRWTVMQYDALNRPITTTLNYEDGKPLTGPRDADLLSVTRYDTAGRVQQQIDNAVYDLFTATQPITDRITLAQYDSLNRVVTTTLNYAPGLPGAEINRLSVSDYNPSTTRLNGQRDPLGRWVSQQYDLLGRVTTTIQNCRVANVAKPTGCDNFASQFPDRNVPTRMAYDTLNRTTIVTDALNIGTRTSYDGVGRTSKIVRNSKLNVNGGNFDPSNPALADTNVSTSYQYDGLGSALAVTDTLGFATRYTVNGLGQTTQVTDQQGRVTQMGYDGVGLLRWMKRPDGQVMVYQVDGLGRVVTTIVNYQDGIVATNEPVDQDLMSRTLYDQAGRRLSALDPAGRLTRFIFDNLDRLTYVAEYGKPSCIDWQICTVPLTWMQYGYDRAGNRTTITDAASHSRSVTYDAADEQKQALDPLGFTTVYTYDQLGRLTNQQDPRGSGYNLSFTYDGLDRRTQTAAGNPANLATITAGYDALGRRLSLSDGTGSTSFTYDALGRMLSANAPNTGLISYSYDGRGSRTKITYPGTGAPVLTYSYFADGQLNTVSQSGVSAPLATYTYDPVGRLAQVAQSNNTVINYAYDKADRLHTLRTSEAGTTVSGFQYQTDRLGLRTVITETLPLSPTISPTRIKTITFEGASLTDPTTGADSVQPTATAVALESSTPLKGSYAARFTTSGGYLREDISAVDELYVTFYLRMDALPGANLRIARISNGGTTVGSIQLLTNGKLRLRNNGTTIGLDSAALTIGALYRVGLHQKKGSGANAVLEAFLADASTQFQFTAPFAASAAQTFTTQATRFEFGGTVSGALNVVMDDVTLDGGTFAPPSMSMIASGAASSADSTIRDASTAAKTSAVAVPAPGGATFGRLPLAFVANAGQTDPSVRALARGMGGTLFVAPGELVMALRPPTRARGGQAPPNRDPRPRPIPIPRAVVRVQFVDANATATVTQTLRLPGVVNELIGNDPAKWRTNLPTAAGVVEQGIYAGIDLHYTGVDGQLKSTYVVAAGADASRIRWRYLGAGDVRLDADGNLVVTLPPPANTLTDTEVLSGTLIEHAPTAWQTINEREVAVPVRFVVGVDGSVSFALGAYDHTMPLTIDPTLVYSTFLGGSSDDVGDAIAVDSAGNAYVTGYTASTDFPTAGPGPRPFAGSWDAFVAKLNPAGNALVYSTFLGGNAIDIGIGIAVDSSGNADVIGQTNSTNFPMVNAAQPTCDRGSGASCTGDGFVTKLNATGSGLLYSTYLGGSGNEYGYGIAVDSAGTAYVAGSTSSSNFLTTASAAQPSNAGGQDAFVAKINPSLSGSASLLYSTYLGGSGTEGGYGIALDSNNTVYVTGETTSTTFPTKTPAQANCGGSYCDDAFVAKINPSLSGSASLIYSTYLGGSGSDIGWGIAVDPVYSAYVVGETTSTDLITTTGVLQGRCGGATCDDAFVTKLTPAGSARAYSTYLGGSDFDVGSDIAVDRAGNAYVTGMTTSDDFPLVQPWQAHRGGFTDVFVAAIQADGRALAYSTYLGGSSDDEGWGIAVDLQGNAYVTGDTPSANFPLANPAYSTLKGGTDAFVAKLSPPNRIVTYSYDGLLRLIGAAEGPGNTYAYGYDSAGNRTSVQLNGGTPTSYTYNAANQVTNTGWTYDNAGNLTNDGSAAYTYDALNRMTQRGTTAYTSNGDGVLVKQVAGSTTTYDTQDLAAPLTQILQTTQGSATTNYLYGAARLASLAGSTRTWYAADGLGSVRRTLSDSGTPNAPMNYDPWGTVESGTVPTFGFTGELQDSATGLVNLRARWYSTAHSTFTSFRWRTNESDDFVPYTHHGYAYALSNPVLYTDPTGKCVPEWVPLIGEEGCTIAEGAGKGRYDIVGAGKVVVAGGGVAATVVGCAATALLGCAAVGAGAAAVTSWGTQALDNAGKPVVQAAVTDVSWGTVARDATIGAASSFVGGAIGKGVGFVCRTGPWCATAVGAAIGSVGSGTYRILGNLTDGNPNTTATAGVIEACAFGAIVGGITGRLSYGVAQWWSRVSARFDAQTAAARTPLLWDLVPGYARGRVTTAAGTVLVNGTQTPVVAVNRFQWKDLAKWAGATQVQTEQEAIAFLRSQGIIPRNAIALTSQDLADANLSSARHAEEIIMRWAEARQLPPLGIVASNQPCAEICQRVAQELQTTYGWDFPLKWLKEVLP